MKINIFKTEIRYPPRKKHMNLDPFKTPHNLPFLYYAHDGVHTYVGFNGNVETTPHMTLKFATKPTVKQPSLDDLWEIEDNYNIQRAGNHEYGRIFAANILCNAIARKSRRACGNILIVPNETERMWFSEKYARLNYNIKVLVDSTLAPNELRATYWKIMLDTMKNPVAVDGGIQFSPDGFSCITKDGDSIRNYSDYFARGFM